LIKPEHGNLLSVRLNAEMKGDYSQPGLMPGDYLEQIDLPSAYLGPLFPSPSLLSTELACAKAHCRHRLTVQNAGRHSGTGFSEKELKDAINRLKPLSTNQPRSKIRRKIAEKVQWVRPELVCEVAFAEWTEDEQLRQTTFLGWRYDKGPEEVVLE
jgi:hypothetical protein